MVNSIYELACGQTTSSGFCGIKEKERLLNLLSQTYVIKGLKLDVLERNFTFFLHFSEALVIKFPLNTYKYIRILLMCVKHITQVYRNMQKYLCPLNFFTLVLGSNPTSEYFTEIL